MVLDTVVLKRIWGGTVVARFTLSPTEIVMTGTSEPLYLTLQRNSYLPLYQEVVKEHFASHAKKEDSNIWFDVDGKPLKWHYPIGVLMDAMCTGGMKNVFDINVHFDDLPENLLIQFNDVNAIESYFMSTLKEADHLKHRGQVINGMNKSQHKQLWNSLRAGNFDMFWSINAKLMEGSENSSTFKYIPLRIYENEEVYQDLVLPCDEDGNARTLNDALISHFKNRDIISYRAILHGVELPLNSSLQWLSEHMSYADNFLHLALVDVSQKDS